MTSTTETRRQVLRLLGVAYHKGITAPQIAEQLEITRQTALNHIKALEAAGYLIIESEAHHYSIDPSTVLKPLDLNIEQTWLLYLPIRRMVRSQQAQLISAQVVLKQLAISLNETVAEQLVPENMLLLEEQDKSKQHVFQTLTRAWLEENLVEIEYQPPNKASSWHRIKPYWFEPAVWTDSAYVICQLQQKNGSWTDATLKLERIEQAKQIPEKFMRPEPSLIMEALADTWGIWLGDEPVQVRLKFANRVRQRLLETRWHPSQKVRDQDDGSVLWEGAISEPLEMLPWIRSWGADVEVLEPKSIRDAIAIEADKTARIYGMCDWGKNDQEDYF